MHTQETIDSNSRRARAGGCISARDWMDRAGNDLERDGLKGNSGPVNLLRDPQDTFCQYRRIGIVSEITLCMSSRRIQVAETLGYKIIS